MRPFYTVSDVWPCDNRRVASATATSVFISRIRGLPVLDSAGDQVGKVRDVVVQRRADGRAPRVKGLVVELFARHRIFIPMVRVRSIDAVQVVISGVVNTRRFERRESETLVIDDLFDLTVERLDHPAPSVIFDVAMRPVRSHDWELSQVALREAGTRKRFGRRGHVTIVDWSDDHDARGRPQPGHRALLAQMEDMKPADVARELHDMSPERRAEVASALDDPKLADALEELPEDEQVQLISELDTDRAADILEEMDPDDAADLIAELAPEMAEVLLARMEPDEAKDVRRLLNYAEFTAGGMMTPEPVILPPDATVADALARIRDAELTPALACMVYVCRSPLETPTGRFIGAVHFQRLLREPPSTLVSALIDTDLETLTDDADLHAVSRYFATYNLVNAPVVDAEHRLIGAITVDDVLDHVLPQDWRGTQLDSLSDHDGEGLGRRAVRWLGPTGSRPRLNTPGRRKRSTLPTFKFDRDAFGKFAEGFARFMGTARFLVGMTVIIIIWVLWNVAVRSAAAAVRQLPVHLLDPDPVAAGLVRRPADPAGPEPAGGPGPGRPGPGPRAGRAEPGRHGLPGPRDRQPADVGRRAGHPRLPPLRAAAELRAILAELDDDERG